MVEWLQADRRRSAIAGRRTWCPDRDQFTSPYAMAHIAHSDEIPLSEKTPSDGQLSEGCWKSGIDMKIKSIALRNHPGHLGRLLRGFSQLDSFVH